MDDRRELKERLLSGGKRSFKMRYCSQLRPLMSIRDIATALSPFMPPSGGGRYLQSSMWLSACTFARPNSEKPRADERPHSTARNGTKALFREVQKERIVPCIPIFSG